jgi:hypothetical protein
MWYVKSETIQNDGTNHIIVVSDYPCCVGKVYLYIEDTDGKIYHEGMELGQGMYDMMKDARQNRRLDKLK